MVRVTVSGFGAGGKFFLSECASPADANSAGCGQQLAAQVFGVTDDGGRGSVSYAVHTDANPLPYDTATTELCHDQCVLVATAGIGYGYTYAPLSFSER